MKIIEPSFEILEQKPGIDGIYKQIELAGRTCYKSENKITADSAKGFVERMISNKHYAMLEHGTVYLKMFVNNPKVKNYETNKYSKVNTPLDRFSYITTNLRVIVENGWMDDLDFLCDPTEYHDKRATVLFHTQIAITREFNRHRVNSMAESSTRYCNYSKDKFGNELSVNIPEWVDTVCIDDLSGRFKTMCQIISDGYEEEDMDAIDWWYFGNLAAEMAYMNLIRLGKKPQEARVILPLDTNTDLVHTAFVSDWKHFFDLRAHGTTGAPHPDAKALALPLYEEFLKRGYIR